MIGAEGGFDPCLCLSSCTYGEGPQRFDVFTGGVRRHRFIASEKAAIVEERYADGTSVCGVARRHGLPAAVDGMLLDMPAAIARKDYEDRHRRQAEGTAKAKAAGRYKGRPEDVGRNAGIATMLRAGSPWRHIEQAFGCSRNTIARVRKRLDAATDAAQD